MILFGAGIDAGTTTDTKKEERKEEDEREMMMVVSPLLDFAFNCSSYLTARNVRIQISFSYPSLSIIHCRALALHLALALLPSLSLSIYLSISLSIFLSCYNPHSNHLFFSLFLISP